MDMIQINNKDYNIKYDLKYDIFTAFKKHNTPSSEEEVSPGYYITTSDNDGNFVGLTIYNFFNREDIPKNINGLNLLKIKRYLKDNFSKSIH